MYSFSQRAIFKLREAGWTEGWHFDTADYEQHLNTFGIKLFACVREFLARYGNLEFAVDYTVTVNPGVKILGVQITPRQTRSERLVWLSTGALEIDDYDVEMLREYGESIGAAVQYIGEVQSLVGQQVWLLLMDSTGKVYTIDGADEPQIVGISGEDALEACLTDRPWIALDELGQAKHEDEEEWKQHVERTGRLPLPEVMSLLPAELQESLREVARRVRREILAQWRTVVRSAAEPMPRFRGKAEPTPAEWIAGIRKTAESIARDMELASTVEPPLTADEQTSLRAGKFVCAAALYIYGDFGAALDVVDNVDAAPSQTMRQIAYVIPLLLPAIHSLDPVATPQRVRDWLVEQNGNWRWNEEQASYENIGELRP